MSHKGSRMHNFSSIYSERGNGDSVSSWARRKPARYEVAAVEILRVPRPTPEPLHRTFFFDGGPCLGFCENQLDWSPLEVRGLNHVRQPRVQVGPSAWLPSFKPPIEEWGEGCVTDRRD